MKAVKLQLATRTLLSPTAQQWAKVPVEEVALGAVPLHKQPSPYVRSAWAGKPVGAVRGVKVKAAHNGQEILFRLEWADVTESRDYGDGSVFPDGAAVLLPLNGEAPIEMGSPKAPVNAWYWRASREQPQSLLATGPGTLDLAAENSVLARAAWRDGVWRLVIGRPLTTDAEDVQLAPASSSQVAFAVWEGSGQERAGLKSFSRRWLELEIE